MLRNTRIAFPDTDGDALLVMLTFDLMKQSCIFKRLSCRKSNDEITTDFKNILFDFGKVTICQEAGAEKRRLFYLE